ncbi:MAG: hypothetical protein ACI4AQ_10130 [Lachnospiraceae bacterium]
MSLRFTKNYKRPISLLLAGVLVVSMTPVTLWSTSDVRTVSAATKDGGTVLEDFLTESKNVASADNLQALMENIAGTMNFATEESLNPAENVDGDTPIEDIGVVSATKSSYRFTMNEDSDLYDESIKFKFTDATGTVQDYTGADTAKNPGIYKTNIKKTGDNTELRLSEVGTIDNPYVVLEITPSAAISEIRPHIGDAGFFDLSYTDVYGSVDAEGVTHDGIQLTKADTDTASSLSEETTVRMNLIEKILLEYNTAHSREFAEEQEHYAEYQVRLDKYNADVQARLDAINAYDTDGTDDDPYGRITSYRNTNTFSNYSTVTTAVTNAGAADDAKKEAFETALTDLLYKEFAYKKVQIICMNAEVYYQQQLSSGRNIDQYGAYTEYLSPLGYPAYYANNNGSNWPHEDWDNSKPLVLNSTDKTAVQAEVAAIVATLSEKFVANGYSMTLDTFRTELPAVMTKDQYAATIPEITPIEAYVPLHSNFRNLCQPVEKLNGRGTKSVSEVLTELESYIVRQGIMTKADYDMLLQRKYDDALEYKRLYERSIIYTREFNNTQYSYDYDYLRQYEVNADGTFKIYGDGSSKTFSSPTGNITSTAAYGEYAVMKEIYNPLATVASAMYGGSYAARGNEFLITNYTFRKSCMNLGYKKSSDDDSKVDPCVDEYIFAGWLVDTNDDGVLEDLNTLAEFDTDEGNEKLEGVTELYTKWIVRDYDTTNYYQLTLGKKDYVKCSFGGSAGQKYSVYLPNTIASQHANNPRYHNIHNQLTMCVPVSTKVLFLNSSNQFYEESAAYVDEISSWDFDFDKETYNTVAKLKQVAPQLMADTDYYVRTYNPIMRVDPVTKESYIEYQPYNIQVITITPEELNKLVYYDYSKNAGSADYYADGTLKYHESATVNAFINNVDFVYFSNGGGSTYFDSSGSSKYSYRDIHTHTQINSEEKTPVLARVPELCSISATGNVTYDKTKVKSTMNFFGNNAANAKDLEWQVAFKIYTRSGDKSQARRTAVIVSEAFGDKVSGTIGDSKQVMNEAGDYINGTENNLAKVLLMYFAFVDPTMVFDMYVDPEYSVNNGVKVYTFDKIKGALREEEMRPYMSTWFTGSLYEYQKWNPAVLFPYEFFEEDHKAILQQNSTNDNFNIYDPYQGDTAWPTVDGRQVATPALGSMLYDSLGLVSTSMFKNIANPYAYTFNGNTDLSGAFFDYNRGEVQSINNSGGNTFLAFEYFREVRPSEIRNDKIATKSAIEFMVQNAQNGVVSYEDRMISILNPDPMMNQYKYETGSTILVEKVSAQDVDVQDSYVNFDFSGSTNKNSILKVEYYWTYRYKNIDNDNRWGDVWYNLYTSEKVGVQDRWFKMPDSTSLSDTEKVQFFKTFAADQTTEVSAITKAPDNYFFNALIKPEIKDKLIEGLGITSVSPTYIIVVKEYRNQSDIDNKKNPLSITTKNVTVSKLSLLFNLD